MNKKQVTVTSAKDQKRPKLRVVVSVTAALILVAIAGLIVITKTDISRLFLDDTTSDAYVVKSVRQGSYQLPQARSNAEIQHSAEALESFLKQKLDNQAGWDFSLVDLTPGRPYQILTWCHYQDPKAPDLRCSDGVGVSESSNVKNRISVRSSTGEQAQKYFSNVHLGHSFRYVENSSVDRNYFSLHHQDDLALNLSDGVSVVIAGAGLDLDQVSVEQGPANETLYAELQQYLRSSTSLKDHYMAQLEKLRAKVTREINSDTVRKYTDECRQVQTRGSFVEHCKTARLTPADKDRIIAHANAGIDKKVAQVEQDYEELYQTLRRVVLIDECPECWR